jgi:hypothetical protein
LKDNVNDLNTNVYFSQCIILIQNCDLNEMTRYAHYVEFFIDVLFLIS